MFPYPIIRALWISLWRMLGVSGVKICAFSSPAGGSGAAAVCLCIYVCVCMCVCERRGLFPLVSIPFTASLMGMSEYDQHTVVTFEMNTSRPLIMVHKHPGCWNICMCVSVCDLTHLHTEVVEAQVSHTPKSSRRIGDVYKCPPLSG